jgi:myo-inositol-1(or 4)-monophosphatase
MINVIDSFLNFKRANDNFGINISLFEKNIIQTNLFYNPIKDVVFYYEKVSGAFKNETRIRVSNIKKKEESIVSVFNNKSDSSLNYEGLIKKNLSENYFSTIESGSCYSDLSNLSCGNIDCCIIINPANKVLQEASLIVNSTGGHSKIIDLKDLKIFIAGNKFVDKMVSEMIEESLNT